MNRKGFTLVELLAVIVILGVIGGIATVSVLSTINKSKDKSEKIFVSKLSTLIEEYLDLYSGELQESGTAEYTFKKCKVKNCNTSDESKSYSVTAKELSKKNSSSVTIDDLIAKGLINEEDLINPKNKEKCFNSSVETNVRVFRDNEYVYYYYVDLSGTSCEISNENKIINTLPDSLKTKVGLS